MNVTDYPQVGRGWAFPPRWDPVTEPMGEFAVPTFVGARVALNDGIDHVREAMRLVLRTGLGERVMRPQMGAGVDRYVFEPRTADTCRRLEHDVQRALLRGEPRVIVDSVEAVPAGDDSRIDVSIAYRIDRHRRPDNLVLPFYVEEGA